MLSKASIKSLDTVKQANGDAALSHAELELETFAGLGWELRLRSIFEDSQSKRLS